MTENIVVNFEKDKAGLGCNGTVFGMELFKEETKGYLDELTWGFIKKGMKIHPHRHYQREVYIFIRGEGTMQVDDVTTPVKEGTIILIPSNSLHTAWNDNDADLEFIIARVHFIRPWIRKIVEKTSVWKIARKG